MLGASIELLAAGPGHRGARSTVDMRTYVRAVEQPDGRGGAAASPARLSRSRIGTSIRRSRGPRHALLRGAVEVGAEQSAGGLADAVPVDGESVQGVQPCLQLLFCPPDPHLPRLRRRSRL